MIEFVSGLILGILAGYVSAYFATHPDKWTELKGLFKKKPPTP